MEIQNRDTIPYTCDWSNEIFIVHVPIDSSTHYAAFYTFGLHCQTPTLTPACQAGSQFVPFLWWSFVWPGWGMNQRPAWEADTLTTKPSRTRIFPQNILYARVITIFSKLKQPRSLHKILRCHEPTQIQQTSARTISIIHLMLKMPWKKLKWSY